eukprot:2162171-Amphidinium_carterae.2
MATSGEEMMDPTHAKPNDTVNTFAAQPQYGSTWNLRRAPWTAQAAAHQDAGSLVEPAPHQRCALEASFHSQLRFHH